MYLLDTHIYLWFLLDAPQLPGRIKDILQTSDRLFMSIGSFWEMAIKTNLGKLELPVPIANLISDCRESNIQILQIAPRHLEVLCTLPKYHGDPFDRLIISQGMADGMTLISADRQFRRYDVPLLWA